MKSILLEDNAHWVNPKCYDDFIYRDALKIALNYLATKEVLAIIGARRVGKSTLAKLMIKELLKTVSAKNIFFINLEKPSFIPYKKDPNYLQKIFDEYLKLANPSQNEKIYFFIDDIQIFKHWEVFIKFIITGSNSSLLRQRICNTFDRASLKIQTQKF